MNKNIKISIFISFLICSPLSAAPTGQQLLEACEKAVNNNYKGIEAQMCEWYVTPCDCDINKSQTPRVCLPEKFSSHALALKVIDGLKAEPELTTKSAGFAASSILSRTYPCND